MHASHAQNCCVLRILASRLYRTYYSMHIARGALPPVRLDCSASVYGDTAAGRVHTCTASPCGGRSSRCGTGARRRSGARAGRGATHLLGPHICSIGLRSSWRRQGRGTSLGRSRLAGSTDQAAKTLYTYAGGLDVLQTLHRCGVQGQLEGAATTRPR
jgi:hypothetical protein